MKSFENIHIYPTQFTNETRILRITKSLVGLKIFSSVLVIASLLSDDTPKEEIIDDSRHVIRIKSTKVKKNFLSKIIYFFILYLKVLVNVNGKNIKCVNVHSLSVLPLGALMKFIYKAKLIYDAHEIETETQEVVGVRKIFSKAVERIFMNVVDITILTSQGHADWYARNYKGSNIEVVENFPYIKSHQEENQNIFRKKFNISEEDLVFIYQGYLSEARGVKLILDSFKEIDVSKHIVFMGFGDLKDEIEKTAIEYPNIHSHESVAPDQVYNHTRCADVGIHMMDDSCINHLYALPNKPMEYMNAGLPAIVSDLPIMGALVRDARSGWLVKPNDQEEFKGIISNINKQEIALKSQHSFKWAKENNWEKQEKKLALIYKHLNY